MDLNTLLKISRPRFWVYTLGPFLIGYIAGVDTILFWKNPFFFIFLLYFLIPANIFIYGINDIGDSDTDKYNKRKGKNEKEAEVESTQKSSLLFFVSASAILGILFSLGDPKLLALMILFLFISAFYSIGPLRFKSRPIIDAYSNVLYIVPGVIGFVLASGSFPSAFFWILGTLWVAGMQVYSAIPDIEADKKAGLTTTPVFLGHRNSLLFVFFNWLIFSILVYVLFGPLMLLTLIYPIIPLLLYWKSYDAVEGFYKYFPLINGVFGFVAFWYIYLNKYPLQEMLDVFR